MEGKTEFPLGQQLGALRASLRQAQTSLERIGDQIANLSGRAFVPETAKEAIAKACDVAYFAVRDLRSAETALASKEREVYDAK